MLIYPIKRKLSEKIWEKIEVAIIFKILVIFKGLISEKKNIIHSYNLLVQCFANRYFVEHFMGRVSWSKCLEWSLAFRVFIKNQYLWIEVEASEWAEEEGAFAIHIQQSLNLCWRRSAVNTAHQGCPAFAWISQAFISLLLSLTA